MEEDYITHEQAVLLRELGFPEESLPTQSLVQKWLRSEKKLHIEIKYSHNTLPPFYIGMVFNYNRIAGNDFIMKATQHYSTYEEVLSEGIDICIEVLKKK